MDRKDIGYCVILTIENVTKEDKGTYEVLLLEDQANNNKPCNLTVSTGGNKNQAYSHLTKTLCKLPEEKQEKEDHAILAALGPGGLIAILVTILVLAVFFLACAVCFWCKNSKRRKQKRAMRESIKQLHVISEDQDKALKEALLKKTTDTTDRGTETVLDTRDMSANTDKTGRVDRECNTHPVVITYPGSSNTHPMAITYPGNSNTHPMAITTNSSNASGANVSRPLPQPFDHARPQSLYLVQPQPPNLARCQSLTLPFRQASTKKNRTHSVSVSNGPSVTTPLSRCALAEEEDDSSYTLLKENGRSSLWGREGTYNKIQ